MKHPNSTFRSRIERRKQAEEMAEVRANLTPQQQIKVLDSRLGKNKGAKKERARLKAMQAKKKGKGDEQTETENNG